MDRVFLCQDCHEFFAEVEFTKHYMVLAGATGHCSRSAVATPANIEAEIERRVAERTRELCDGLKECADKLDVELQENIATDIPLADQEAEWSVVRKARKLLAKEDTDG